MFIFSCEYLVGWPVYLWMFTLYYVGLTNHTDQCHTVTNSEGNRLHVEQNVVNQSIIFFEVSHILILMSRQIKKIFDFCGSTKKCDKINTSASFKFWPEFTVGTLWLYTYLCTSGSSWGYFQVSGLLPFNMEHNQHSFRYKSITSEYVKWRKDWRFDERGCVHKSTALIFI